MAVTVILSGAHPRASCDSPAHNPEQRVASPWHSGSGERITMSSVAIDSLTIHITDRCHNGLTCGYGIRIRVMHSAVHNPISTDRACTSDTRGPRRAIGAVDRAGS
jgi:hypothetical protein